MDFMADRLGNGRQFRLLNVVVGFNCEGLGLEVDFSLPAEPVVRALNQIIEWRGIPRTIRVDSSPDLDLYIFESTEEVQKIATEWLWSYNPQRPNMGNGGMTPAQKLKIAA